MQSAVEFPTPTRIHIGVGVSDVAASVAFYRTLFGQEPTKVREGYAKFEVHDPAVNFSLNEHDVAGHPGGGPQHFGIQVKSTDAVDAMKQRLGAAGLNTQVEEGVTCCYALQDKVWAVDPDGHRWEIFVVLDADAGVHSIPQEEQAATEQPCCGPTCCT